MAKQRKEDAPPPGSPAWMATFGDMMNLLLCFFVLLFSMSTVDAQKFEMIVASFSETFSIFQAGATAIGEGVLISNGVSQLNELDEYINSTGKTQENDTDASGLDSSDSTTQTNTLEEAEAQLAAAGLAKSEELAEKIAEAVAESNMQEQVDIEFTSQYVQLTLKGALLFDSGKAEIRTEALPVVAKAAVILERYAESIIEVEGHTDDVPMNSAKYANNNELSSARALSVFDYLVENTSLEPGMIKHSGRGEYVPVADNSTAEGRAKNRRVEIRIYHSLSAY